MKENEFSNINTENSSAVIKRMKNQVILYQTLRIVFAILLLGGIILCVKSLNSIAKSMAEAGRKWLVQLPTQHIQIPDLWQEQSMHIA